MSPKEICHELQIPEQTFYQWRSRGVGPHAYRIGRHLRITRSDLDAWLAQRSDP
nr:helix-turn-helix domain-containing protein [Arthrobacter dokdonellae]